MFGAAHRDVQYPPPHKAKQWLKIFLKLAPGLKKFESAICSQIDETFMRNFKRCAWVTFVTLEPFHLEGVEF